MVEKYNLGRSEHNIGYLGKVSKNCPGGIEIEIFLFSPQNMGGVGPEMELSRLFFVVSPPGCGG